MRALLHGDQFPRLLQDMRRLPGKWARRGIFLLGPWVCLWMVEILNENDLFEDLYAWQVLMNMVWYYILFGVCRLILGRCRRAAAAGAVLSFLVGLLNHYILRFRGRILFPADVTAWRTAANVADGFDYSMDVYMVQASVLLVAYLFLVWACPPQPRRARLPLPASLSLWALILGYSFAFFCTGMLPALGIFTQQWVTQRNGFLLNFTVALRYSSVEKPEDYSEELVLQLMEQYPALPGTQEGRPINILVVMNESFADFSVFDTFEASEDPTPFLHSLEENTIQGWMYSTVTGGGTATVEFEYLTGFTSLFQPPHTVAYQLYVEEDMPSLAALAGTEGYETTAFHPYLSSGWNRILAYDYLNFDHQMYQEDVINPQYIRHYISDLSDYQMLFRATALEELITYYQSSDEPTLIVFFGDHQPPLTNAFYEQLYGKKLSQRTTEEVMQQYAVPFFIWANYDIEEQRDVVISPNYLGVLTAQVAGLPMTGFMNFLSQLYEQLPAITPVGFVTAQGQFVEEEELTQEQQEWLHTYEILNYCGMVDLFDQARPMFCFHPEGE